MAAAIDSVRAQHGLPALRRSSSLSDSAGRFARRLMETDSFGHLSRIPASSRFASLGEALAMHSGWRYGVRSTLRRWLASPPHRAIVLSGTMHWQGAGVVRGRFSGRPATIWVLHVGALRAPDVNAPSLPSLP